MGWNYKKWKKRKYGSLKQVLGMKNKYKNTVRIHI